jgi:hypothetical protein
LIEWYTASCPVADLSGTLQCVDSWSPRPCATVSYICINFLRTLGLDAEPPIACLTVFTETPSLLATADPMHFTNAIAATSLLAASACAWTPSSTNGTDRLAAKGLANLKRHHASFNYTSSCDISKAPVRKEWLSLSDEEKIAYTNAVKCLMDKPSISGAAIPGAKSRFDDFVGVHINQTLSIHATVRVLQCLNIFQPLTYIRATSFHGTDISPGHGSIRCARSAATKATSHTSTGESTLTTSSVRHCLMAVRPPLAVTESSSLTTALESLPTLLPTSSFHLEMDLAVSPAVHLRT